MTLHLAEISQAVKKDAHAVVLLDQAGWHGAKALEVPDNITLLPLPPRSPELSSTTAASPGTSSSISPGKSCPSGSAIGPMGADQWELVLHHPRYDWN
jgi:hypothetical protein